ncbi:MAG: aminotransferase class I/II-fold pyridoxal phosphate-dependent enzyme [Ruminococcus sp.]|nr:aminotransferase class I/II-fold pyridoxal phosphate-dependent enzyme [Ruminococcus sp.]
MTSSGFDINKKSLNISDLSGTANPLGMPASVRHALADNRRVLQSQGDPACCALRRSLSVFECVPENRIACGNGGDDMLFRLTDACKPKKAVIYTPCSGVYRAALEECGCEIMEIALNPDRDFGLTSDAADFIYPGTDMVIIGNPCDPTGGVVSLYTLLAIAKKCEKTDTIMVCDERFMQFVYRSERYSANSILNSNIVIIKSFDEIFATAGLPMGYAVFGDESLAEKVRESGKRAIVSGAAQAAGIAAARDDEFVRLSRRFISLERKKLAVQLTRLGLPVLPSKANFLMFRCELPLDEMLRKRGIVIKKCGRELGLSDDYFRVAVGTIDENKQLVSAIERIFTKKI